MRRRDRSARHSPGNGLMTAMQPLFDIIFRLEGFEAVAFWFALLVGAFLMGYFVDYVMQGQGFGALFNCIFVLAGTFAGLFIRYNYIHDFRVRLFEPYLSIGLILSSVCALLILFSFVRNRTS
jgi:uncharacterized membrane protein YeaQ/YmgE (transglycosylase-associated protein family)